MLSDGHDGLFHRLVRRFRSSRRAEPNGVNPNGRRTVDSRNLCNGQHGSGFFNNANNFVVNQPTLIENRGFINNFAVGTTSEHI